MIWNRELQNILLKKRPAKELLYSRIHDVWVAMVASILIHDGVRPLIGKQIISDNIESVKKYGSAVTCAPTKESVVLIDEKNNITEVVERNESRTAKAPESFYLKDILAADEEAISKGIINEIDSCTLMAHHGAKMHVVNGDYGNIKITTPEDFYTFRAIYDVKENEQLQ